MEDKCEASDSGLKASMIPPDAAPKLSTSEDQKKEVTLPVVGSEIDLAKTSGLSPPCSRCGKVQPIENFHRNKSKKSGYESHCKKCVSEAKAKSYEKKKKKFKDRDQFNSSIIGEVNDISGQDFARAIGMIIKECFTNEFFD